VNVFKQPGVSGKKGAIDNIDHAYSGIVNVYALVPPGSTTSIEDITGGIMSRPPSAKIYPQLPVKAPGNKIPGNKTASKKIKVDTKTPVRYDWKEEGNKKHMALYGVDARGEFIWGGEASRDQYTKWLNDNPKFIKQYNESDPIQVSRIRKANFYIKKYKEGVKYRKGSKDFEDMMLQQAMRLQVPLSQMEIWYKKYPVRQGQSDQKDINYIIRTELLDSGNRNNPAALLKLEKQFGLNRSEIDRQADIMDKKYKVTETRLKQFITTNLIEKNNRRDPKARKFIREKYNITDSDIDKLIKVAENEYSKPGGYPKEKVVINVDNLPLNVNLIPRVSSQAILNTDEYTRMEDGNAARELYKRYPANPLLTPVVYTNDNDEINYYMRNSKMTQQDNNIVLRTERKRKLSRSKILFISYRLKRNKKVSNPKKKSKSSILKKSILSKLKCNCRGKRK